MSALKEHSPRGRLIGVAAAVFLSATVATVLVIDHSPGSGRGRGDLSALVEDFPVPAGAVLINEATIGTGDSASHNVAWSTSLSIQDVTEYYAGDLSDPWVQVGQRYLLSSATVHLRDRLGRVRDPQVRLSRIGDATQIGVVLVQRESSTEVDDADVASRVDLIVLGDVEVPSLPIGLPAGLIPSGSALIESTEVSGQYVAARFAVDSHVAGIVAHIAAAAEQIYGADSNTEVLDESSVLISWSEGELRGAAMAIDGIPATVLIVIEP
jgi:hypothetical protein